MKKVKIKRLSSFRYDGIGIPLDDNSLRVEMRGILATHKGEKNIADWWYKADAEQQTIIMEEIAPRLVKNTYLSCDKRRADFVQFIYSANGFKATISKANTQYKVTISKNDKTRFYKSDCWQGEERGTAYCFEVPSGCLVLRKDGKVFITMNCGKSTLAAAMFLYGLHKVMCLRSPRSYYGLSGNKKITFIVVNPLGLKASLENSYGIVQGMLQSSPWFMARGVVRGNVVPAWHPNGQVA